jgi:hypothetical protein
MPTKITPDTSMIGRSGAGAFLSHRIVSPRADPLFLLQCESASPPGCNVVLCPSP